MNGGGLKDHSNDELAAIMAGKKVGVGFSMTDRFFLLPETPTGKTWKRNSSSRRPT